MNELWAMRFHARCALPAVPVNVEFHFNWDCLWAAPRCSGTRGCNCWSCWTAMHLPGARPQRRRWGLPSRLTRRKMHNVSHQRKAERRARKIKIRDREKKWSTLMIEEVTGWDYRISSRHLFFDFILGFWILESWMLLCHKNFFSVSLTKTWKHQKSSLEFHKKGPAVPFGEQGPPLVDSLAAVEQSVCPADHDAAAFHNAAACALPLRIRTVAWWLPAVRFRPQRNRRRHAHFLAQGCRRGDRSEPAYLRPQGHPEHRRPRCPEKDASWWLKYTAAVHLMSAVHWLPSSPWVESQWEALLLRIRIRRWPRSGLCHCHHICRSSP